MTRLALLALLTLPLPAATVTLTQSAAYQFTSPAWAVTPPQGILAGGGFYDAEIALLPWADISWLGFTVTGNGVNEPIAPASCCNAGTAILRAALPLVADATYLLTIHDLNPGVAVPVDFNSAYFGLVPVDPPIGETAVPEPGMGWMVGLVLLSCVVFLRGRMIVS